MPYISTKERQSKIKKLSRGNGFRKWFIFTAILLTLSVIALLIISLIVVMANANGDSGQLPESIKEWTLFDGGKFTTFGWVMFSLLIAALVFDLFSLFVVLSFKSSKKSFKETISLATTALPGRKNKKSAAAVARERVAKKK